MTFNSLIKHAQQEMIRGGISEPTLGRVMTYPDQIVIEKDSLVAYQFLSSLRYVYIFGLAHG